jgi:hypothetical protein
MKTPCTIDPRLTLRDFDTGFTRKLSFSSLETNTNVFWKQPAADLHLFILGSSDE